MTYVAKQHSHYMPTHNKTLCLTVISPGKPW